MPVHCPASNYSNNLISILISLLFETEIIVLVAHPLYFPKWFVIGNTDMTSSLNMLARDPDPVTREELQQLVDANRQTELTERFSARLAFGTAGLRGIVGAGPNQ